MLTVYMKFSNFGVKKELFLLNVKEFCKFEIITLIPCVSLLLIITKLDTVEFFIKWA